MNQKIPVPTYFDTYPGASFVNGADGQGAAVATALVAAASDIGAVLMSKKLHNARQQYLKSLKEDKKGTLFNRRSKRFFRSRILHAGLNWLSGLMASGFDTINWHTQRQRTGNAEKVSSTFGHLSGAYLRTRAPREDMISFRVVAAMITLLWRLAIATGGHNMTEHQRNMLVTVTRGFEAASLLAGVKIKSRGEFGTLVSSLMARLASLYMPFLKGNTTRQTDPRMAIHQAFIPESVTQVKKGKKRLNNARVEFAKLEIKTKRVKEAIDELTLKLKQSDDKQREKVAQHLSSLRDEHKEMQKQRKRLATTLSVAGVTHAHRDDEPMWEAVNADDQGITAPLAKLEKEVAEHVKEVVTHAQAYHDAVKDNDPTAGINAYVALSKLLVMVI